MRRPPDKDGQPALSERDVDSSNATLNTLFGGARQKSWMMGAGTPVRPTPRTNMSRTVLPPVAMAQRNIAGVLPSPAPSDEPSPIISNTFVSGARDDSQGMVRNDENRPISTADTSSGQNRLNSPSEADAQIRRGPQVADTQPQPTSSSKELQSQPRRQPLVSTQGFDSLLSATTTEIPPLPASVLLPSDQEYREQPQEIQLPSLQEQLTGHQQVQSPVQWTSPAAPGPPPPRHQYPGPQVQSGQGNQHWQGGRDQLPSPTQTSTASPRIMSDVALPSAMVQNQTQSYPSPGTFHASASHKRQKTQVAVMPPLKHRVALIEAHIKSVGGRMNLNAGLEKPRFQLLTDACNNEDSFYVALHQIFCVWDFDQNEVASIQGFPEIPVLQRAFQILGQLIRDNEQLAPNHKKWFAGFPSPLGQLMRTSETYRRTMHDVGIFLGRLAVEWVPLSVECNKRGYPPLVDELVTRMGLLSPILQGVVFTATRRTLGIGEGEAGMMAENLFRKDQHDHQALAARYNTNRPPTANEVNERNQNLAKEYVTLHNRLIQQRHTSTSAAGSSLPRLPTQVVPGNAHIQSGTQMAAAAPWQQQAQHQSSWNQNMPSHDPTGAWQLSNQHPQMMARTTAGQPNPSLVAGGPLSVGSQGSYPNTPSPILLQGLSMQSPIQQGFQPTTVVRSNNSPMQGGQVQVPQNGPAYAGPIGMFYQNGTQNVDPSMQQRIQMTAQQQQQQQQHVFAAQQGPWQQNQIQQQQQHQQHQQHFLSQQVMNLNRAAQLRQSSNVAIDLQQRAHSRNNSTNSSSGHRTPGVIPVPGPSPRPIPSSVPGPRRAQPIFLDQIQNDIQAYNQIHPLHRALVPPIGYVYPSQPVNPEMTALHQAHIRSPLLVTADGSSASMAQDDPAFRYYQAVRDFALDPARIPMHTPLSKFEFRISEADFNLIAEDGPPGSGQLATRQFRRGTLQYRLRCVQMKRSEAMCSTHDWVIHDTVWPENASLEINKKHLEIRRKNHHGKDLPIDITAFVRASGPNSANRITLSIIRGRAKMKEFSYFLAVETVEILQHSQILDMCQRHRIPAIHTLDKIKKSLATSSADDDEIAVTSSDISVDLSDPFTARVFEIPARGRSCLHRECFDLETFLLTRNSKPKRPQQPCMVDVWKCPLCGRDARPYNLEIDDFLASVRSKLAEQDNLDVKAIWISADGSWRPKEAPRSSVKRSHPEDSEDSSDEDSRKERALSAGDQVKSKETEVIALDED